MDILTLSLAVKKALAELGVKPEKTQTTVFQGSPFANGSNWAMYFTPVADKEYTVTVNGETSTQKATAATVEDMGDCILLGNQTFLGGDANGVEWAMLYVVSIGVTMFIRLDNAEIEGTTITITTETETIHPIDPKFLPGVCLPVVELSTAPTAEGAVLSADEVAKIFDAFIPGIPFIVSAPLIDGLVTGVIMSGFVAEGTPLFGGAIRLNGTTYGYTILKINDDVKFFRDEG